MKAIVRDEYGTPDVLTLREIAKPPIKADEVLVRVHASTVTIGDWFWLTGSPLPIRAAAGILAPRDKVLGRDVAGVVESVGSAVTSLRTGDEVYGEIGFGAHAEYVAASPDKLARKPDNLTFDEAAAVPLAGVAALQGLRDAGRIRSGQRVLINGASGAVGTFAVQVAKAYDTEATAVCSGRNAELVRSIGADHVIDYTRQDFTAGSTRYDLIFDLAGSQPVGRCRGALTPSGVYVASTSRLSVLLKAALTGIVARGQVTAFAATESQADLEVLREFIEKGSITPVIDGRYQLDEVPEALRRQGAGHAQGRKVISIAA